ncbi:YggT family protein, partial [Psychrobacter sp. 1U2]
MNNTLLQIFDLVTTFAMMLVFIRFMLQFAGMDERNPMIAPAYKATRIVDTFGRIFPTVAQGRISIAAIVLMFLIRLVDISGKAALMHKGIAPAPLFFAGTTSLVLDFLRMCRYLVIGSIIVS